MTLLKSDSLSRLVAPRPESCHPVELYKLIYSVDEANRLQERFFPLKSQVEALQAILSTARTGDSFLLMGPPATGKSVTLSMLARGLTLPTDSASLEQWGRQFDAKLRSVLEGARPPGGRWLVLTPHLEPEQDFLGAVMRSLWAAHSHTEGEHLPLGADLSLEAPTSPGEALDQLLSRNPIEGVAVLVDNLEILVGSLWTAADSPVPSQIRAFRQSCLERQLPLLLVGAMARTHQHTVEDAAGLVRCFRQVLPLTLNARAGEWEEFLTRTVMEHFAPEAWAELGRHPDLVRLNKVTADLGIYAEQEPGWIQEFALEGPYPLHPAVTFLLPRLTMRLARPDKTALSFFIDANAGGLGYFLNNFSIAQPTGRLSLYTVDLLFSFLEKSFRADPRYNSAMVALEKAYASSGEIPMARRLLRTVWMLQVAGHERVNTSPEHVMWALHLGLREQPHAAQSLKQLVEKKVLVFRGKRFYLPFETERLSLDRLLRDSRAHLTVDVDLLHLLESHISFAPLKLNELNRVYSTDRYVKTRFVLPAAVGEGLVSAAEHLTSAPYHGDLLLGYVVAQNLAERDLAAVQCQSSVSHPRLVVAIPTEPQNYVAKVHEIEALKRLRTADPAYTDPTSAEFLELTELLRWSESELEEALCALTEPERLEFWHQGNARTGLEAPALERWLEQLVQSALGFPPVVGEFAFSTVQDSPGARERRFQAVAYLLGCHGDELVLRDGSGPVADALRAGLVETGLFSPVDDQGAWQRYRLADPLPEYGLGPALHTLLSRVLDPELRRQRANPAEAIAQLMRPPYSLPAATVELLLAVAAWEYRDRLFFYRLGDSAAVTPEPARLHEVARAPAKWRLEHFEVPNLEHQFLEELIRLVAPDGLPESSGSLVEDAARVLTDWFDRLPPSRLKLTYTKSPNAGGLIDLLQDPESRDDPRTLLLEHLPQALGCFPPIRWEEVGDTVLNRFETTRHALEEAVAEIRHQLHEGIRWIFADRVTGARRTPWPVLINRWYSALPQAVRTESGNDELKLMLSAFSANPADEDEALGDLLHQLGYPDLDSWEQDYTDEILERMRQARMEMEWQDFLGLYRRLNTPKETALALIRRVLQHSRLPAEDVAELLQSELEQAAWTTRAHLT